jgi:hypothetical protein
MKSEVMPESKETPEMEVKSHKPSFLKHAAKLSERKMGGKHKKEEKKRHKKEARKKE